jgi:hypothetical protein
LFFIFGSRGLKVPDAFFKVILADDENGNHFAQVFLFLSSSFMHTGIHNACYKRRIKGSAGRVCLSSRQSGKTNKFVSSSCLTHFAELSFFPFLDRTKVRDLRMVPRRRDPFSRWAETSLSTPQQEELQSRIDMVTAENAELCQSVSQLAQQYFLGLPSGLSLLGGDALDGCVQVNDCGS